MTTWTTISNAAVAVGGIPSSTTVTALRDNPLAIAESASGAPVVFAGWHPYDKVTVGDGKAGLIYDAAVNGTVANVVTPDFEDGFEYRIIAADMRHNAVAGDRTLNLELYKATSGVYATVIALGNNASSIYFSFDAEIIMPRVTSRVHLVRYSGAVNGTASSQSAGAAYNATSQKILRARVSFDIDSINIGKVYLFRRREYASLS